MNLVDESLVISSSDEEVLDDGFIEYQDHRLFIMEPDFDETGYLDLALLMEYLGLTDLNEILKSILTLADREVLSCDELETVFNLENIFDYVECEEFYKYDDDLQHILHLVRRYYVQDDDKLLSDTTLNQIRQVIQRVYMFRQTYEYDDASLPYGNHTKLRTNLATFLYMFEQKDDDAQSIIRKHMDAERAIRKRIKLYVGDYSVVYNPLMNKLFLWDYTKEHTVNL